MDPLVLLAFAVTIGLEVSIPVILGYFISKKLNVKFGVFIWGATIFIAVQVIHTPLVLLTQQPLGVYLASTLGNLGSLIAFSIILGLLAGLFEETGRYLSFRYLFGKGKIDLKKQNGLMFGAGWAGAESIFVAILVAASMLAYIVAAPLTPQAISQINASVGGTLTDQQLAVITQQNQALMVLAPSQVLIGLGERMMTIIIQMGLTLMVFTAVLKNKKSFYVLAIAWHTVLDALAVFLVGTAGILVTEMSVFVMMLIALWYIRWQWKKLN